ncbi:hypothetical protein QUB80_28495 [Chlorogloeopsis sp. ULAP01]|nr:hypothetical protein [Chlorogloeopsis sp. ULAP01]
MQLNLSQHSLRLNAFKDSVQLPEYQIFRENIMKAFLTRSIILLALAISTTANFALPAKADSTANLLHFQITSKGILCQLLS